MNTMIVERLAHRGYIGFLDMVRMGFFDVNHKQ